MAADRPRIPPGTGSLQRLGKIVTGPFIRWYCRLRVKGVEHIPATGPVIIAANHRSLWDVPIHAVVCPRPITFMAKRELYRGPLTSWFFRVLGGFPVNREGFDIRAMDSALAVLDEGSVLGLYPEGTRSLSGEMLPFLEGAAWIALRSGVSIVPSGISGTGKVLPPGTTKPWFGKRVVVRFGPPIPIEREDDRKVRREKAQAITKQLLVTISELSS